MINVFTFQQVLYIFIKQMLNISIIWPKRQLQKLQINFVIIIRQITFEIIHNLQNMQEAIQIFQKQLKNKLQYKASSKISPDTYLYKSFKFFDLYNNGYLSKGDFFKAIAKCGVVVDTHNVQAVYKHYSNPENGNIYYKEFIERLLFSDQEESEQMGMSQMGNSKVMQKEVNSPMQKSQLVIGDSRRYNDEQPTKESRIDKVYQECDTYSQVTASIKRMLRERGITSLLNFAVELKSTDLTHTHKINKQKLKSKLTFLSDRAIDLIISQFASNNSQQINYAQLIYSLKGQLETVQQNIIEKAFTFLDSNNEKQVDIQKVIQLFKNNTYREEFIKGVELYESFQGIDDGVFTDEDFVDFFGFLAFAFADVDKFVSFVERAYFVEDDTRSQHSQRSNRSREFKQQDFSQVRSQVQQPQQPTYQPPVRHQQPQGSMKDIMQPDFRKNKQEPMIHHQHEQQKVTQSPGTKHLEESAEKRSQSRKSHSQADKKSSTTSVYVKEVQMIVLRIKKRLASKGTKGFLIFQKALKNADTDMDGLITLDQFKQVVRDLKIDITNNQSNLIFDVFDPDSTNLISFHELIHTFKGVVPEKRNQFFQRVWLSVKLSEQHTAFSHIKQNLNFRGHPDIQTGRKYDDEVWKEIQETLLLIQELNDTPRSEKVTKKEFFEYLENLSLTTSEDLLFESILQNFWKMQSKVNISQMYAGSRKLFDPSAKGYLMDHHRYAVKGGSISSNAPFGTSNQPTNYFTQHSVL